MTLKRYTTTKLKCCLLSFPMLFFITGLSFGQQKNSIGTIDIKSKQAIIAGTLLLADKSKTPTLVIFVSSVVGNNRDISGHRDSFVNFPALAEQLKRCGISSFRFDNRGIDGSTGNNQTATIFTHAEDVQTIFKYFKRNKKFKNYKIGLLGHSEGAAVATVVASQNNSVSFLAMLSAQGISGWNFWKFQVAGGLKSIGLRFPPSERNKIDSINNKLLETQASLFDSLEKYTDTTQLRLSFEKHFKQADYQTLSRNGETLPNPYLDIWLNPQQIILRKFIPEKYLIKVKCPILCLNGDKDDSVEGITNLLEIERIAKKSGNINVVTKLIPNVNHYYRTLKNDQTWNLLDKTELFSSIALETICSWFETLNNQKNRIK
jgi:pimeloyl-ACP methyl ester carboxylesterase